MFISLKPQPPATPRTQKLITDLAFESGLTTIARNLYLSRLVGRRVRGVDEILQAEASKVIEALREAKLKFKDEEVLNKVSAARLVNEVFNDAFEKGYIDLEDEDN